MGRKFYIIMILLFTCLSCGCADRRVQGNSLGEDGRSESFLQNTVTGDETKEIASGTEESKETELDMENMEKDSEEKQFVDDEKPAGLHGFSPPQVRLISVNGPVDITVYDAGGNVVAATIDEEPMLDGDLVTSITRAGEKQVYLPIYRNYTVQLTATADGVMYYVIEERDHYAVGPGGDTVRLVFFNDIEVRKGQEYTTDFPKYSEEKILSMTAEPSDAEYVLCLGTEQIRPDEELNGEGTDVYYEIHAESEDVTKGLVLGAIGLSRYGSWVQAEAVAYAGYEFIGWYEGENLVSTELEYNFRVSRDMELTARFKEWR